MNFEELRDWRECGGTTLTETAYAADGQQRTYHVGATILAGEARLVTAIEEGRWRFSERHKVVLVAVAEDGHESRFPLNPFRGDTWPTVLSIGHKVSDGHRCEKCSALPEDGPFCIPPSPLREQGGETR